MLMAQGANM
jgi:Holliday junction resolvase-like predicted endonuclease